MTRSRLAGILLLSILVAAPGCGEDSDHRTELPGEDFQRDTDVRVISPSNGETVASTFAVVFEAGDDVQRVRLDVDDEVAVEEQPVARTEGSFTLTLDDGRHALALVGADGQGQELSRHELTVRVAEEDSSWVTIVSPPDGAEVANPVRFVVDASTEVDSVSLYADDWELGSTEPGGMLSYEFSGTGFGREIQARAYDDGELVATDDITITVTEGTTPEVSDFNQVVVDLLEGYPTDGTHPYLWDGSTVGVTQDIWYLDTLVAEGSPGGTCYCVGITWEVFMLAFEEVDASTSGDGTLNEVDVAELYEFRTDWYVRDLYGAGAVDALEYYGIGEEVTDLQDVRQGDFVQFWRNSGSGHSVVFDDWEIDGDGDIIGVHYWSCQGSTDGLGYVSEYFGTGGSYLDPSFFFVGRAWMPDAWLPW